LSRRGRNKESAGAPQVERLEAENRELRARLAALEAKAALPAEAGLLASLSHEIRTPLNGILGLLQLVPDEELPPAVRSDLATVRKSAEALLALVNDTLDFAKIESGRLQLESIDFDLVRTVEDVVELLAEPAHRKGVELFCSFAADVPRCVRGDPGRLRQVLTNLVGNAVKFTAAGEVAVHVAMVPAASGLRLCCTVRDSGIGMTPDQVAQLFRPFHQAEAGTTRRFGGTGLGLAISAHLCRLMGGAITVDSEPGKGSSFRFEVAVEAALRQDAVATPAALRERTILVVEPSRTLAQVLVAAFSALGMRARAVDSCEAATGWLLSQPDAESLPDFVLVDAAGVDEARTFHAWLQTHPAGERWILFGVPMHRRSMFGARSCIPPEAVLHKPYRRDQLLRRLASMAAATAPLASVQAPELRPGLRVLVAEDTPVNQMVTMRTLQQLGYDAELAIDGAEAVAKVKAGSFDLVLMDCQMPRMDGFEAARTIRALDTALSGLPIIAMTADGMSGARERCLAAGMNDCVSKPVRIADLRAALRRWC